MTRLNRHADEALDKVLNEVEDLIATPMPEHGHDWRKLADALRYYVQQEVKHALVEALS